MLKIFPGRDYSASAGSPEQGRISERNIEVVLFLGTLFTNFFRFLSLIPALHMSKIRVTSHPVFSFIWSIWLVLNVQVVEFVRVVNMVKNVEIVETVYLFILAVSSDRSVKSGGQASTGCCSNLFFEESLLPNFEFLQNQHGRCAVT